MVKDDLYKIVFWILEVLYGTPRVQSVQLDLIWVVVMGDKIAFQMVVEFVGGKNKNSRSRFILEFVTRSFCTLQVTISVLLVTYSSGCTGWH